MPSRNAGVQASEGEGLVLTRIDAARRWCQTNSLWPLPLGLACCAIEFMGTAASRFDMARFGMEVMRFSPRQADLMIVSGWLTYKMAEVMTRLYDQMSEPKWVVSMGACASSGGMHRSYPVVQGIDEFIPVDMYIPGCPPRPEAVLNALIHLQDNIAKRRPRLPRPGVSAHRAPGGEGIRAGELPGEMAPPAHLSPGERWYEGTRPPLVPGEHRAPGPGYDGARGYLRPCRESVRAKQGDVEDEPEAIAPMRWRETIDRKRMEGFDLLLDLTAIDYPDRPRRFTIVAILARTAPYTQVLLQTSAAEGEAVQSLCGVYEAANWSEREVFDMFGIPFEAHPDLTRILLPQDFEGWPLRRDFPCEGKLRFRD